MHVNIRIYLAIVFCVPQESGARQRQLFHSIVNVLCETLESCESGFVLVSTFKLQLLVEYGMCFS